MNVVINNEYGGYGLSTQILKMYLERTNTPYTIGYQSGDYFNHDCIMVDGNYFHHDCIERHDPVLIEILKELDWEKKGLKIVLIPDFAEYSIGEYDGQEWIDKIWIDVSADELRAGLSEERLQQVNRVDFIRMRQ